MQSFICCLKGRRISHQITVFSSKEWELIKKEKEKIQRERERDTGRKGMFFEDAKKTLYYGAVKCDSD